MNTKPLPLLVLLFLSNELSAQQSNAGPRINALGNTGVVVQDVWSIQSNQAGLAAIERPQASIAHEILYLNSELSTQSAVFAYPTKRGNFGLGVQSYGFSAYRDQKIGLAFAKPFGENLFVALDINYHQIKIQNYGSDQTFSVEAGLQFRATNKLLIGTHIANPSRSGYGKELGATVPTTIEVGAAYSFSDKVLLTTALIKDLAYLSDARLGLEYEISEKVSFRGGINLNPFRHFGGFGLKHQKLRLDAAASYHPDLGYSPQLALGYEF